MWTLPKGLRPPPHAKASRCNIEALPLRLQLTCRRLGVPLSRHVLVVDVATQTVSLFERTRAHEAAGRSAGFRPALDFGLRAKPTTSRRSDRFMVQVHGRSTGCRYTLAAQYRCSTSRFGIGQQEGSNCTPLGLHWIAEKIGGGWPVGAVFQGRKMRGFTWRGWPMAPITTRILWLAGLEPGFNQKGHVDSFSRYIYIHGTGDEPTLGRPASRGCIHLAAADLIPLYDRLPVGTLVWIQASGPLACQAGWKIGSAPKTDPRPIQVVRDDGKAGGGQLVPP